MDEVFARINTCRSSLGEQYLYRCIRRSPHDYILREEAGESDDGCIAGHSKEEAELEFLERQVKFFAENNQVRYQIQ